MPRAILAILLIALIGIGCRSRPAAPATDPDRAYRANNLGVALMEQFRFAEAASAFRDAVAQTPSLGMAHFNLGLALFYSNDLAGAIREATEAARLMPESPAPPFALGLMARAENRRDDARTFFERVRRLDPDDVATSVNLAQLDMEGNRFGEAVTLLRSATAIEPYNVTAAYVLGQALLRAGDPVEGRRVLNRSVTLRDEPYAVLLGGGYLEAGRHAEAIASTGAEPELLDQTTPAVRFTRTSIGPARGPIAPASESPFGRPFDANALTPAAEKAIAAGLGGALTLADLDLDGDLDLFSANSTRQQLLRNDGAGNWTDITSTSGLDLIPANAVPIGAVAGDYDNDGRPDLFVLRYGVSSLYHNEAAGRFRDATGPARLPPYPQLPSCAAFVDVDHDGDVDLVVAGLADLTETRRRLGGRAVRFPNEFVPAPLQLVRNNGNGTFTDITRDARLNLAAHAVAIVPTDFDNRRDIDLLIVSRDTQPLLLRNMRDGTFRDVAASAGLTPAVGANLDITAVTSADVNKDGSPDFFFAGAPQGTFALSNRRGGFTMQPAPDAIGAAFAAQFVDYDNDGLVDLLAWSSGGPRVVRNLGRTWRDVTSSAMAGGPAESAMLASSRALSVGDMNGDRFEDFVAAGDTTAWAWASSGDGRHRSQRVRLSGLGSNRMGLGARIQVRAGSASGFHESSAATPAAGPADIIFGLGPRAGADVVRVLWPSGVLQAEVAPTGNQPPMLSSSISIRELDRKASSCPFLFTWNGTRFEFVTDFMGGGEMGYWEGPGLWNHPDPVEYVRIRADQLRPKDGRLSIRVTNELEETLYADRFQLLAISHPTDVDVFPSEGMTTIPRPFGLHVVRDKRPPRRVVDEHGHDVTDRLARVDRRYPDDFAVSSVRGYADRHDLVIDLAPVNPAPVLLMTAWTDYAFSSDNRAAHQAGLGLTLPSLEVRDSAGGWRMLIPDVGIPVGRPQTIALDLTGRLRPGEHDVRIVTNMRIYWDEILIATSARSISPIITRIDPLAATLRARGFSRELRPDGREPLAYDYDRTTTMSPWKVMPGRYTREGDVLDLVTRSDDRFVISQPGDEIAFEFADAAASHAPAGWARTFLLMADGFSKEMDPNSASPDGVEPLPFHGMPGYPYRSPAKYPDTPAHQRYREMYNTRTVVHALPSIDLLPPRR